jgi:putative lipoic acid-binding regulatory protein
MESMEKLKELLDESYSWPAPYLFKFIVPTTSLEELEKLISKHLMTQKPSKNGKYTSVSITVKCQSSQEVLDFYEKVSVIPGIISL